MDDSLEQEELVFVLTTPDKLLGDVGSYLLREATKLFVEAKSLPFLERSHLKEVARRVRALGMAIDRARLETPLVEVRADG
jgi:hypothetical protein